MKMKVTVSHLYFIFFLDFKLNMNLSIAKQRTFQKGSFGIFFKACAIFAMTCFTFRRKRFHWLKQIKIITLKAIEQPGRKS